MFEKKIFCSITKIFLVVICLFGIVNFIDFVGVFGFFALVGMCMLIVSVSLLKSPHESISVVVEGK
ncbi:hypothetical protein [Photobacterium leiognathi]|uniref:hypothetical protein n=1 Tax=Photobacterium leiognathi TaxID=553611 RepID=UPI0029824F3C|nr:hypothetical protein [Photobacterium leiognathi]